MVAGAVLVPTSGKVCKKVHGLGEDVDQVIILVVQYVNGQIWLELCPKKSNWNY